MFYSQYQSNISLRLALKEILNDATVKSPDFAKTLESIHIIKIIRTRYWFDHLRSTK